MVRDLEMCVGVDDIVCPYPGHLGGDEGESDLGEIPIVPPEHSHELADHEVHLLPVLGLPSSHVRLAGGEALGGFFACHGGKGCICIGGDFGFVIGGIVVGTKALTSHAMASSPVTVQVRTPVL